MDLLRGLKTLFNPVTAKYEAARDMRKFIAWQRKRRDELAAAGSGPTHFPKQGGKLRPLKHFKGEATVPVYVTQPNGKKKRVMMRVLEPTDSTPNRYEFARLDDDRRDPSRRKIADHKRYQ